MIPAEYPFITESGSTTKPEDETENLNHWQARPDGRTGRCLRQPEKCDCEDARPEPSLQGLTRKGRDQSRHFQWATAAAAWIVPLAVARRPGVRRGLGGTQRLGGSSQPRGGTQCS
eukprot:676592-Rhodomonas_salina.1